MKFEPDVRRKLSLWYVGLVVTLAGLAVMIVASFVVIGYLNPVLGSGVYVALALIAVALSAPLGLLWRWLARG
jgi:hypothetical protein